MKKSEIIYQSLGLLSFKRVQSILDFLFFPVSRISLMVVVFCSNVTMFLHCHLIKRITICKGYQRGVMRERLLFIHIRVAHSGALGTAINWGPDKN